MDRRSAIGRLLTLAGAMAIPPQGAADERYPSRPVKVIVPFPAGSVVDVHMRKMAPPLSSALGQSVVVDNRPGASGTLGVALGAQAKPDGYTLTLGTSSGLAIAPAFGIKTNYDPLKDFVPITLYARTSLVLVAHPSLGVGSLRELVALAKRKPGELAYGNSGNTSIGRLACEVLQHEAGIELRSIAYKTPVALAVLGNEVPLAMDYPLTSAPHVSAGKLNALVSTGSRRVVSLPSLPTLAEAGFPGAETHGWAGLLVPAGTPSAIVASLNQAVRAVLQRSDIRDMIENEGSEVVSGSSEEFRSFIASERGKFERTIKRAGIEPDKA